MKPDFSRMNLKNKFFLFSTVLLIIFSLLLSILYYLHLRRIMMDEALKTSEVILQEVEAIRGYVGSVLRPKMYDLHTKETFIIEAMSTTYVSNRIMERFSDKMEGYIFRRASLNPHNPQNQADPFEEKMFEWFEESRERTFWQGIVSKEGKSFFISMIPDYFEASCIHCHGDYREAPKALVDRYGKDAGFRFQAGDLAGINSVAIPVSAFLARITKGSIIIFVATMGVSALLLFLFTLLFNKLVIERLATILHRLPEHSEYEEEEREESISERNGGTDELDTLDKSFGTFYRYMKTAHQNIGLQPNFIGKYSAGSPISAGTMSWLYSGKNSEDGRSVSLKLGFEDVLTNPLYSSCLQLEFTLFETLQHNSLLKVIDRVDDTLILEELQGSSLDQLLSAGPLSMELLLPLMEELCDLTASFHSGGIVHHDLRPANLFVSEKGERPVVKLIDMGLASWREKGDALFESGLGPQGDFRYMAPEQIHGTRGDCRSDIYTLGILLYRAVTGKLPFEKSRSTIAKWLLIKKGVAAPSTHVPQINRDLEKVILKCLEVSVDKRYQWVEDLWDDLSAAVGNGKRAETKEG